jgi:fatty acid desaturase
MIGSGPSAYRVLLEEVRAAGLLDRRPAYYSVKMAAIAVAFAAAWAALFLIGNSWATLGIAAFLAFMFTQVVFVGHDAGHQQIFRSRRANWLVGLVVGNILTGLSFGWWVPKHNAHHAHPNQVDRDPDIGAGVISFTAEIARRRRGIARALARWQAWFFFPLLLLEGLALHVASIQTLIARRDRPALVEALLLVGHAALYLGAIFWVLSPLRALVFIAVQQSLFGLYLGATFAPNHKGMPIIDHDADIGFAERQVITARNVTGGRFTAMMLGGLNYQIEHHLFPTMPRANLAKSQALITTFCTDHDLPYRQDSLIGSYRQSLRYLGRVGSRTNPTPAERASTIPLVVGLAATPGRLAVAASASAGRRPPRASRSLS